MRHFAHRQWGYFVRAGMARNASGGVFRMRRRRGAVCEAASAGPYLFPLAGKDMEEKGAGTFL